MEIPLPWERLLWRGRSLSLRATRYVLTDVRIVSYDGRRSDELALQDIGDIQRHQSRFDRLIGASTLLITTRARRPPFVLKRIRRGAQLAALLELLAGDSRAVLDPEAFQAALTWEPRVRRRRVGGAIAAVAIALAAFFGVAIGLHGKAAGIAYASDDPIYPAGEKRERDAIVQFMQREVMPWARQALAPIKGGADRVTCETCHGPNAEARGFRMPGVGALPRPDLVDAGWETYSAGMDTQMRNAIYGYTANSDKQTKAAYMRGVVMPGMARLLRRPAYDFTSPYDYNRSLNAFGCYHCHRIRD